MRIEGVSQEVVPASVARIYLKAANRHGRVPTPLTALAHCPGIIETLTALSGAIAGSQGVEPRLKTLASLRAAQIAGCPF